MTGPVNWDRADRDQSSAQRRSDLDVHPWIPGLGREQIGDVLPVPGGPDGALYQHRRLSHDLVKIGHELREHLGDHRTQHVPSPAYGGLADPEDRASELLGDVL